MDYVVGSVAALISGNVTPNRPRLIKKAFTPTKHQPSPNVTPKSEFVEDRSIFLSPTLQKKKAIVKKSPKRIFQNPDLDITNGEEGNSNVISPKVEKVKKHLKNDLNADETVKSPKSPKNKHKSSNATTRKENIETLDENLRVGNENTPKKKKHKRNQISETSESENLTCDKEEKESVAVNNDLPESPKKKIKPNLLDSSTQKMEVEVSNAENHEASPKKKKKQKSKSKTVSNIDNQEDKIKQTQETETESKETESKTTLKKKNKKRKNKTKANKNLPMPAEDSETVDEKQPHSAEDEKVKKNKKYVNPNAITDKDTDSEHESDDEIVSENEEINKEILNTEPADESSEDEDEEEQKKKKPEKIEKTAEVISEDEIKRTLFVGNVPFSSKCKKEIKKIFNKHGQIETIRIRTIPIKDARDTPKLAVIKNELHPERTTVNVYIKYKDPASVELALAENNTVLNNNHLRVSKSDCTGAEHDPRCSVFVGNLPFALEDEALREKFENCGEIESVRIIRDKKTNAGKGFGYVNFKSKDGVELALALPEEDLTIKNRILRVKRCNVTQKQSQGGKQHNVSQQRGGNQTGHQQRGGYQQRGGNRNGYQQRGGNHTGSQQRGGNQATNQQRGGFKKFGQNRPGQDEEGAQRRIMNKRKYQDESREGPENKRQKNINQPSKEKKVRKEFVGMTAEKKKKIKINKGQKKKKALSEILTK